MSACISTHGEYSAHEPDDEFVCRLCGELDEGALRAELARLRTRTVKPAVEDVARVIDPDALDGAAAAHAHARARAVLDLLPGRYETEVKAEAWDEGDAARRMYVENRRAGRHVTMPRNPYRKKEARND